MIDMKIFSLNSGSSSVKCALYDFSKFDGNLLAPVWEQTLESPEMGLETVQKRLTGTSVGLIGHRIVHGGKKYTQSVKIDEKVKKEIRALGELAPLHNLADIRGIEAMEKLFPKAPQCAVFDTAFHHTLSDAASTYPGPYAWKEQGIHRFGFHGISFQYCTDRAAAILKKIPEKMVICHLGSGASLAAIAKGKSIDTTMGFTPLEGLMMDTRSGTVDPGILLHLMKTKTAEELTRELYEQSGLLGLSGISSDMRDILKNQENLRAKLALDVYLHRLTSSIGAMVAALGGLDTLVFTAGIGENAPQIRAKVCQRLAFLGLKLHEPATSGDRLLSAPDSPVKILLIHTQETFQIAKECWNLARHS